MYACQCEGFHMGQSSGVLLKEVAACQSAYTMEAAHTCSESSLDMQAELLWPANIYYSICMHQSFY